MIVCSVGCYGDRGHDGDIAGGVELSAKVGLGPRGRERPGEEGETIRGLTAELQGWLAGSGTRWRRRIRRRRWSEPEEGNGDVAAMQGFRGAVERWGGRGSRGGASELVGGARGGRRQLLWRTAATVVFGRVRERARERRGEPGESEREQGGGVASSRATSEEGRAGKQGERWRGAVARARAGHTPLPLSGRRRQRREVGWAGCWLGQPAGWAAQWRSPGKFLPLFIFCFCFYLIYLQLC